MTPTSQNSLLRVLHSLDVDLDERIPNRIIPTLSLSPNEPIGVSKDFIPSIGWRNGSATR